MRAGVVEIRHNKGSMQRELGLDKTMRDAMADYWRFRWPSGTAKHGAREYNLSLDQARGVVAGRASQSTIDQIFKAGGWDVIFAVGAMVVGHTADQHIIELRARHEEHGKRFAALVGDGRPWSRPADPDPDHVGSSHRERRNFDRRRVGERDA